MYRENTTQLHPRASMNHVDAVHVCQKLFGESRLRYVSITALTPSVLLNLFAPSLQKNPAQHGGSRSMRVHSAPAVPHVCREKSSAAGEATTTVNAAARTARAMRMLKLVGRRKRVRADL